MASVIITLKIMPSSPKEDLAKIENESKKLIEKFGGKHYKTEIEPVAFGLKAIKIIFVLDESKGSTDKLEEQISSLKGVNSVDIIGITRTFG